MPRPAHTASFVRVGWDARHEKPFGHWRVSDTGDPMEGQTVEVASEDLTQSESEVTSVHGNEGTIAAANGFSEEIVLQEKKSAYEAGLAEGERITREKFKAKFDKKLKILESVIEQVNALHTEAEKGAEWMARVAMHVAEQVVRAELSVPEEVIKNIIRGCIDYLDKPQAKLLVEINSEDYCALQEEGDEFIRGLQFQDNPSLSSGSVVVRANETIVEDLIENRLISIADQLLRDKQKFIKDSTLISPHLRETINQGVDDLKELFQSEKNRHD